MLLGLLLGDEVVLDCFHVNWCRGSVWALDSSAGLFNIRIGSFYVSYSLTGKGDRPSALDKGSV